MLYEVCGKTHLPFIDGVAAMIIDFLLSFLNTKLEPCILSPVGRCLDKGGVAGWLSWLLLRPRLDSGSFSMWLPQCRLETVCRRDMPSCIVHLDAAREGNFSQPSDPTSFQSPPPALSLVLEFKRREKMPGEMRAHFEVRVLQL